MPSPAPWTPTFDFAADPAPQSRINAAALQAQLAALSSYLAQLETALDVTIRDDDTLVDEIVQVRNLSVELRNLIMTYTRGTTVTNALAYFLPVRAASVANVVNLFDAQTVDGVALVTGDRVLLKNQTTGSQNGLWIVYTIGDPVPHAAGLWQRSPDLPSGSLSGSGWAVDVREGTVNGQSSWAILAGVAGDLVGTATLTFFPVFGARPLPVARGGTGAATAAGARANLGAVGKETVILTGDGIQTTFTVAHTLGTQQVFVAVRADADTEYELTTIRAPNSSQVAVVFVTPPVLGATYTVIIQG